MPRRFRWPTEISTRKNGKTKLLLIGVVSWGPPNDCGLPNIPGVYARVTAAREWIKTIAGV